jgi:hypothetical protein
MYQSRGMGRTLSQFIAEASSEDPDGTVYYEPLRPQARQFLRTHHEDREH